MPKIITRDPEVEASLRQAVTRIEDGKPVKPKTRDRAAAGTLKLNFATVEIESGVPRHLFDRADRLYPEIHALITAKMASRGKTVPLRTQLDQNRKLLASANKKLERSHSYSERLLERISQLGLKVAQLTETVQTLTARLENAAMPQDEEIIGTEAVAGVPIPARHVRQAGRAMA